MTRMLGFAVALAVFALGGYWLRGLESGGGKPVATAVLVTTAAKKPKPCSNSACETYVTVTFGDDGCSNTIADPNQRYCWVSVLDDTLVVNPSTTITWTLKGAGKFKFDDTKGIEFLDTQAVTGCGPGSGGSGKAFQCTTTNKKDAFKYKINLVANHSTVTNPPQLDPYVVNN